MLIPVISISSFKVLQHGVDGPILFVINVLKFSNLVRLFFDIDQESYRTSRIRTVSTARFDGINGLVL